MSSIIIKLPTILDRSNQTTQVKKQVTAAPLWRDGKNGPSIQFVASWDRLQKEDPQVYRQIEQKEGFESEDIDYKYN